MPRTTAGTRTTAGQRQVARDFGTCLSFNGTSNFVVGTSTTNTTVATVSAWIKIPKRPTELKTIAGFINGNGSSVYDKLLFIDTSGNLIFHCFDGAAKATPVSASSVLPLRQWVHVAGIVNGTTNKSYINGVEVGSIACGNTYAGYTVPNLNIGGDTTDKGNWFEGKIDDPHFYTRAITTTELVNLYNNIEPATTNLVLWHKYDEGSGTSAVDSSPSGTNTGTITGATYSTDVPMIPRTVAT